MKIFNKLPEFQTSLKEALLLRIKECSLKIFMIESQNQYESFNIKIMKDQFKLPEGQIVKQAAKLIAKGDILAKVDTEKGTIVFETNR